MRKSLISLLIAIFFGVLLLFISYNYSPFEYSGVQNIIERYGITEESEFREIVLKSVELGIVWEFLDFKVVGAWSLSLAGLSIALVAFIHLSIDKLFFKSYLEEPDLRIALRRGVLAFFVIYVFLCLHLLGALVWYTVLITFILLLLIEITMTKFKRNRIPTREEI